MLATGLHRYVHDAPSDAVFARRFSLANRRWGLPYDLKFDSALNCFVVNSGGVTYAVSRRSRLSHVKHGVERRRRLLIDEYMIDQVPLSSGDIVLDIGANIGEVSMLVADLYGAIPIAYEPEHREFIALERNLQGRSGAAYQEVLWSHETDVTFHSANETGDSSVFEVATSKTSALRRTTTVDASLARTPYADLPIQLLKLEAEGAEPEILIGAEKALERTSFVTADLGPERGLKQQTTLVPVLKALTAAGFEPQDFHAPRTTMLFRRVH